MKQNKHLGHTASTWEDIAKIIATMSDEEKKRPAYIATKDYTTRKLKSINIIPIQPGKGDDIIYLNYR